MLTPRPYQAEAESAWWQSLCTSKLNPVVVIPTGGGKSLLLAMIARRAVLDFQGRVVILQHRKELIEQNAAEIAGLLPDVPVGIYSAGLKSRDTEQPVLLAGIQSIYNKAHLIGNRHLSIVDEAHLVPHDGEGQYRTFFNDLQRYCPKLRIGGLTATPFRTDSGPLCTPDGIFNKIVYDAKLSDLIRDGYLCPLVAPQVNASVDTSCLRVQGGEFVESQMQDLFGDDAKVVAAVNEIVARTQDRNSILIFCSGVNHACQVAKYLGTLVGDENVGCVVGETSPLIRASTLQAFKDRELRFLVSVDILTTGFNAKCIDAIAILRATMSPGLLVQIVGRGSRLHPAKKDCLILDFGENFKRHGPVDAPDYGRGKGHGERIGEAPTKACPNCGELLAAAATICLNCQFQFPREIKHDVRPDEDAQILSVPKRWAVKSWAFARWTKKRQDPDNIKPDTLRVDYICSHCEEIEGNLVTDEKVSEWVCLEHEGFALQNAEAWWETHTQAPFKADIDEAVNLWLDGAFGMPTHITTKMERGKDGKNYPRIIHREGIVIPEWNTGDSWEPVPDTYEADCYHVPDLKKAPNEDDIPF